MAFALWKSHFPNAFLLLHNSSIAATARVFLCGHGCAPSPSSDSLFLAGTTTPFICAATRARLLSSSRCSPRAYNRADSVLTNRSFQAVREQVWAEADGLSSLVCVHRSLCLPRAQAETPHGREHRIEQIELLRSMALCSPMAEDQTFHYLHIQPLAFVPFRLWP